MTTCHCSWCGWNGHAIEEQAVIDMAVFPPRARYACYLCGQEITPGPHSAHPGYGHTDEEIPEGGT